MKALVPGGIAIITAVTVVIGANAVTGEKGTDPSQPTPRATVDPACEANPPGGEELACIPLDWFTFPGDPERTPLGLKPASCPPDASREECNNDDLAVPDYGEDGPTIVINGQRVELPEDVVIGSGSVGHAIEIIIGESTVTLTRDGTLLHSDIRPADEAAMQSILDAVAGD